MHVRSRLRKAKQRQAKYFNKKAKDISFEIGDPVYFKNVLKKGKLEKKWQPYYRILEKTSPVTYVIKNQLDGSTCKVHAERLRPAQLQNWDLQEKSRDKPLRKAQYIYPPEESSSTGASSDSDDNMPLKKLSDKIRKERDNSDNEEDIPLMELAKRLRLRQNQKSDSEVPTEESSDTIDYDIKESDTEQPNETRAVISQSEECADSEMSDEMDVQVVEAKLGHSNHNKNKIMAKRISKRQKCRHVSTQNVKLLLEAFSGML